MLKYLSVIMAMLTAVKAEDLELLQQDISSDMCRSIDHRFVAGKCIYCAHGLDFDQSTSQCVGTPQVLGKCYGDDHYHAATQECMYCGKGFVFDEDIRMCIPE